MGLEFAWFGSIDERKRKPKKEKRPPSPRSGKNRDNQELTDRVIEARMRQAGKVEALEASPQ